MHTGTGLSYGGGSRSRFGATNNCHNMTPSTDRTVSHVFPARKQCDDGASLVLKSSYRNTSMALAIDTSLEEGVSNTPEYACMCPFLRFGGARPPARKHPKTPYVHSSKYMCPILLHYGCALRENAQPLGVRRRTLMPRNDRHSRHAANLPGPPAPTLWTPSSSHHNLQSS